MTAMPKEPRTSDPRLGLVVFLMLWVAAFVVGLRAHHSGLAVALFIAGCVVGIHVLEGRPLLALPMTFAREGRGALIGSLLLLAGIVINVVMNGVLFLTVVFFAIWFAGAILFACGRWLYRRLDRRE